MVSDSERPAWSTYADTEEGGVIETIDSASLESGIGYDSKKIVTSSAKSIDEGIIEQASLSTQKANPFLDPEVAEFYRDLYERAQYEGRHRFDPEFTWEPEEEARLVRKTEWYVTFWAFFMFFALDVDRFNLSNAVSGTFMQDININTGDYNLGNTINLVCFLSAELPSQLVSKKLGPDVWIPTQMVLWSIVAILQCRITNRTGFLITRAIIGALEGGFIADVTLWMSYFYTGPELKTRIGYFYIANPLTGIISSFISYGIFHIKSSWAGWRWLFLIEGLLTLVIGLVSYFKMPPSVTQTKTWYRKKGWFTERDEKIMVNRILRDDPSKGDMHNRQAISLKNVVKSITDFDIWPIYVTRLFSDMIVGTLNRYLPILLKSMNFSTFNINLLLIPPQVLSIITMMLLVHSSKFWDEYSFHMLISPLWTIPCLIAIKWWSGFLEDKWGSYVLLFLTIGYPMGSTLSVPWASHNSNSVRTRTVSAALLNMTSQVSSAISANIFRPDDAPRYKRGTTVLFGLVWAYFFSIVLAKVYYIWRNKTREAKWSKLTPEEQANYRREHRTEGNRRLDFRFAH